MKDFKGTEGKWEIDPHCETIVRSTNPDNGTIAECHSADNTCPDIVYVSDGTHWNDNFEIAVANAQLIATAPELLESLSKLVEMLRSPSVINKEGFLYELDIETFHAKMIINKALGKEDSHE